jgi:hypothetical protein
MIDNLHSTSLLGRVLGSVQSSGQGVYMQDRISERTVKLAGSVQSSAIGSLHGSIQSCRLGACN